MLLRLLSLSLALVGVKLDPQKHFEVGYPKMQKTGLTGYSAKAMLILKSSVADP